MPIRIYALAKELDMDSKELVEVCTKAGIPGKGSALASLDDDEVAKVRTFLRGPSPTSETTAEGGPRGAGPATGVKIGRGGLRSRLRPGEAPPERLVSPEALEELSAWLS